MRKNFLSECCLLLWLLWLPISAIQAEGRYFGAVETVYPSWFKQSFLDLGEEVNDAAAEHRRLLILFYQDGCPYCNLLVERNLSQREIAERLRSSMNVVAINMFGDREVTGPDGNVSTEKEFAVQMRVQFTPTLLFFDEQGVVVLRLNGYLPPEQFKLALDYVAGHREQGLSYAEYLAANQPAASPGSLISEDFHQDPPYLLHLRSAKPLAIFFEQKQCPDCERLHREVLQDDEIRLLLAGYDVVQLDMWSQTPLISPSGERTDARSWARHLKINYAPSFILFDTDGKEVIRSEAMFKRFHTASMLDYCASGAYRSEPSFQRYLSARAEHIREQGRDVDIWQ
ncbi:MAG: thioredoxin fold domain-containing protein [Chromatiaceae bacterium]|nr:thioredoxin fold domain-containing protein [Chromatiaceae bacterium]